MKLFRTLAMTAAAVSIVAFTADAGPGCGSKAETKTAGLTSSSCAAKAASASDHCASKVTTASAQMSGCSATMAAACATKNASDCSYEACLEKGVDCSKTTLVYMAKVDGQPTYTMSRDEAASWSNVSYIARGTTYSDEHEAASALVQGLRADMQEMLTVAYGVEGSDETLHCAATASAKAADAGCTSKMRYKVANRTFKTEAEAQAFLTKVTERVEAIKLATDKGETVDGCAVGYTKSHGTCTMTLADQKFDDPVMANLAVMQARIRAIASTDA